MGAWEKVSNENCKDIANYFGMVLTRMRPAEFELGQSIGWNTGYIMMRRECFWYLFLWFIVLWFYAAALQVPMLLHTTINIESKFVVVGAMIETTSEDVDKMWRLINMWYCVRVLTVCRQIITRHSCGHRLLLVPSLHLPIVVQPQYSLEAQRHSVCFNRSARRCVCIIMKA